MGLSDRLLTELSAESGPLPPQISPTRVRGLRRAQLVELVRRVGGEEAERLRIRERELELRELAALERAAELETELRLARDRISSLQESQAKTARYELPRLAELVDLERTRADALREELEEVRAERDALAARVAELETGTADESASADLAAAAALFARSAGDDADETSDDSNEGESEGFPSGPSDLSATAEFFGEEAEDAVALDFADDADETSDAPEDFGLGSDYQPAGESELAPESVAAALLGEDPSDELNRAAGGSLPARPAPRAEDEDEDEGGLRREDLERALLNSAAEAAAAQGRAEELEEALSAAEARLVEAERELAQRALLGSADDPPEKAGHQTQRIQAPRFGRPGLPGLVQDASGELDLDHLLGAYVRAEERAARIDVLEEVVWRLEAGKPSSEAWRRALEQVRRACAHEQAAREEAARALEESETQRLELQARLRSLEDDASHGQLELQTLVARHASLEDALTRARTELEGARRALSEAREEAESAGQAWSQAEDELGDTLGRARELDQLGEAAAVQAELRQDLAEQRLAHQALLEQFEDLQAEQVELETELEEADLEVQRLELALIEAQGLSSGEDVPALPGALGLSPAESEALEQLRSELDETHAELEAERARAADYEPARRAFHEAQRGRDEAEEELRRLRSRLAESRQAEAAWAWSRDTIEAALEERLAAAEALRARLSAAEARASRPLDGSPTDLEERRLELEAGAERLERALESESPLGPDEARAALAQSDATLAELEATLLRLGARSEDPLSAASAPEPAGELEERIATLELELAAARGRAGGAQDVASGLRERLRSQQAELEAARARALELEEQIRAQESARAERSSADHAAESARSEAGAAADTAAGAAAVQLAAARVEQAEVAATVARLEREAQEAAAARDLLREDLRAAREELGQAHAKLQLALAERDSARSESTPIQESEDPDAILSEGLRHELGAALGELEFAQGELDASQSDLEAAEVELELLRSELAATQVELGGARQLALSATSPAARAAQLEELEALRQESAERRVQLEALEEERHASAERLVFLEAERVERERALEELRGRLEEAEAAKPEAALVLEGMRGERDAMLMSLATAEADRDSAHRARDLAQAERDAAQAERDAAQAERDAAQAEAEQRAAREVAERLVELETELERARGQALSASQSAAGAEAEQARLAAVLETRQVVVTGLEARARQAEARARQAQAEAQRSSQEIAKLETVLAAQRAVQEGLERHLERARDGEEEVAAATEAGVAEALRGELEATQARLQEVEASLEFTTAELLQLRAGLRDAESARASAEFERDELQQAAERSASGELSALLSEPTTDVLSGPDLPGDEELAAARVGEEDAASALVQAQGEVEDLRMLLSEQEQLSIALRSELIELRARQSLRPDEADDEDDVPVTGLDERLAAMEEELSEREERCVRLESERARLSDEVYDLGRLLESECWRGLATHRDLVRAHQRLRSFEEGGASSAGATPEGSADQVIEEARRSLAAEARRSIANDGLPDEEGEEAELRQQAVAWLLTQAPQRPDALREVQALLPQVEARLRSEQEALLELRHDIQSQRQGLLEDLLTAERAVRHAESVGADSGELDRRARKATLRLGDFDAHLEVDLRSREDARQMLEDLRLWLLWERGEHGAAQVGDADPGEDRVEALELRKTVIQLEERLEEENRQRRQLERDAMQAMEELEHDRQRLEQDLQRLVAEQRAEGEALAELEALRDELAAERASAAEATAAAPSRGSRQDVVQLQRQAERIATLAWDLESHESLVYWLVQELDPRVQSERGSTRADCLDAVRGLPPAQALPDDLDPQDLLHWLESEGARPLAPSAAE